MISRSTRKRLVIRVLSFHFSFYILSPYPLQHRVSNDSKLYFEMSPGFIIGLKILVTQPFLRVRSESGCIRKSPLNSFTLGVLTWDNISCISLILPLLFKFFVFYMETLIILLTHRKIPRPSLCSKLLLKLSHVHYLYQVIFVF